MGTDLPRFCDEPERRVEPGGARRALSDFYFDDPDDIFDARDVEPPEGPGGEVSGAEAEAAGDALPDSTRDGPNRVGEGLFGSGDPSDADTGAGPTREQADDDRPTGEQNAGDVEADRRYTPADVVCVSDHLSRLDHFGANDVMLERISSALAEGRPMTDGQANFMRHEMTEAELMSEGMPYEDAHEAALQTHPPGRNYDSDVIDQFEEFGPWWRRVNGLEPR